MAGEDKKRIWLEAMQNVAADHHALIVREYERLCHDSGLVIMKDFDFMVGRALDWLETDLRQTGAATPRIIQCIKWIRDQYGLGLKEAKDVVDAARAKM